MEECLRHRANLVTCCHQNAQPNCCLSHLTMLVETLGMRLSHFAEDVILAWMTGRYCIFAPFLFCCPYLLGGKLGDHGAIGPKAID